MKIPNGVLEDIIGHPVEGTKEEGKNRQSRRIAVSKRAALCRAGTAVQIPITIIDVSSGGVAFIYSSPLVPGEQFVLRVTGRDGDDIAVECSVRWHMKTGSGRCRIGSEFLRLIEDETKPQPIEAEYV